MKRLKYIIQWPTCSHIGNSSTQKAEPEDYPEFKASLNHIVIPGPHVSNKQTKNTNTHHQNILIHDSNKRLLQ